MMNLIVKTVVRKFLQLMLACAVSVVIAVFVAKAETLKTGWHHEDERVAYLVPDGNGERHRAVQQHGIIAAESDLSTPMTWQEAKAACATLTLHGFSDWSLPTKEDLNRLFMGKMLLGGFQNADYWSSSANAPDSAWSQSFLDGKVLVRFRQSRMLVRPVRKF